MRRILTGLLCVAVPIATSGCASASQNRLRVIAASDLDCPREEVVVTAISGSWGWEGTNAEAMGCGRRGRYIAMKHAGWVLNSDITRTSGAEVPPAPRGEDDGGEDSPADVRRAQATADHPRIDGVDQPALRLMLSGMPLIVARIPDAVPASFAVVIETSYPGQAARCATLEVAGNETINTAEREPGDDVRFTIPALALRRLVGGDALRIDACQRSMWLSRPQREAIAELVSMEDESSAAQSPSSPGSMTADEDASPAPAHQLRAALDDQREVILACVGRDVVGLRVEWDAEGVVSVSLNGTADDPPEEECVRQQLRALSVSHPSTPGELVHVITR